MTLHRNAVAAALGVSALVLSLVACGSSGSSSAPTGSTSTAPTTTGAGGGIVNEWAGPPVDTTRLPIGTSKVSLKGPAIGGLFACDAGNPRGGGAFRAGPCIDESAGTWNLDEKVAVQGQSLGRWPRTPRP